MTPYRNLSGNSGVVAYSVEETSITVLFRNGSHYRYDHGRPGAAQVEQMKRLAESGAGLSTYISQHVGKNFAAKW